MATSSSPSDFVNVQISAAAAKLAPVHVANGHFSYVFADSSASVRVLTSEWRKVLSNISVNGVTVFTLAADAQPAPEAKPTAAPAASAPSAAAAPAPAKLPGAEAQKDEATLAELQREITQLESKIASEAN